MPRMRWQRLHRIGELQEVQEEEGMKLPDWWGSDKPYKICDCLDGQKYMINTPSLDEYAEEEE